MFRTFCLLAVAGTALGLAAPAESDAGVKGNKFALDYKFSTNPNPVSFTGSFNTNGTGAFVGNGGTFDFTYTELDLVLISFFSTSRNFTGGSETNSGICLFSLFATGNYTNTLGDTGTFSGFKSGAATREASAAPSNGSQAD